MVPGYLSKHRHIFFMVVCASSAYWVGKHRYLFNSTNNLPLHQRKHHFDNPFLRCGTPWLA